MVYTVADEFPVQDRWLAAALIVLGLPLLRTELRPRRADERPGPPWSVFILKDHPERPRWVAEYRSRTLSLPVTELRATFNRLRDLSQGGTPGAGRRGA